MPRFAGMLKASYESKGHVVKVWSPRPLVFRWFASSRLAKWAGYIDQYLLFPMWVRNSLKTTSPHALFVFCDQALGPWIGTIKNRPHVIHVHDLLALRSALGNIAEHRIALSGRVYQRYIRRGFQKGRNFISVSNKTRDDLHRYGRVRPIISEVVHNGLAFPYAPLSRRCTRAVLENTGNTAAPEGMILNVGGAQWYKNKRGVLAIYANYAARVSNPLQLWWVGPEPKGVAAAALKMVPAAGKVVFLKNPDNLTLQAVYSHAKAFLYPSLEEGFGWPLIEAQACGCPVITTNEPPMTEIGGPAARYLPRLHDGLDVNDWARRGAETLIELLTLTEDERQRIVAAGIEWAKKFNADKAVEQYLAIYELVLSRSSRVE